MTPLIRSGNFPHQVGAMPKWHTMKLECRKHFFAVEKIHRDNKERNYNLWKKTN